MKVGTRLAPGELGPSDARDRVAVVIDVIRASTTIVAALDAGARRVEPVASVGEARERAARAGADALLCGEREGCPIPGFDLGNSPAEYTPEVVAGKSLLLTTTNGTRVLSRVTEAEGVLVACLRNLGAVCDELRGRGRPALLVCAGREGRVGLDDVWCAGLLAERLAVEGEVELDDGSLVALQAARGLGRPDAAGLAATAAGAALLQIGFGSDLEACAAVDASQTVPCLGSAGFVPVEGGG